MKNPIKAVKVVTSRTALVTKALVVNPVGSKITGARNMHEAKKAFKSTMREQGAKNRAAKAAAKAKLDATIAAQKAAEKVEETTTEEGPGKVRTLLGKVTPHRSSKTDEAIAAAVSAAVAEALANTKVTAAS